MCVVYRCVLCCVGCAVITVVPGTDQFLSINSPLNLTFTCNASDDELNLVQTQAIWEVGNRQIQAGANSVTVAFARIGIFVEEREVGVVDLIVSSEARLQYQDNALMVRCTAFTPVEPPITEFGQTLIIKTYGKFEEFEKIM